MRRRSAHALFAAATALGALALAGACSLPQPASGAAPAAASPGRVLEIHDASHLVHVEDFRGCVFPLDPVPTPTALLETSRLSKIPAGASLVLATRSGVVGVATAYPKLPYASALEHATMPERCPAAGFLLSLSPRPLSSADLAAVLVALLEIERPGEVESIEGHRGQILALATPGAQAAIAAHLRRLRR